MKLGEIKKVDRGVQMWGGKIEQVWLTKWMPTKHYQLLGLVRLENGKVKGWYCLKDSAHIADCRKAALNY